MAVLAKVGAHFRLSAVPHDTGEVRARMAYAEPLCGAEHVATSRAHPGHCFPRS